MRISTQSYCVKITVDYSILLNSFFYFLVSSWQFIAQGYCVKNGLLDGGLELLLQQYLSRPPIILKGRRIHFFELIRILLELPL
jgi:hypothetical protein